MGVSGFCPAIILTIFVTCVGAIMGYLLYMNRQLNRLNDTVTTQQGVLSTLITDIKNSSTNVQFGASPVAMKVAKLANNVPIQEDDSSDEDSDDEDSSDEDSSDEESEKVKPSNQLVEHNTCEGAEDLNDALMSSQFGKILEGMTPDGGGVIYMGGTIHGTMSMDEIGVDNIKDMMDKMNGVISTTDDSQDVTELETFDIDADEVESATPSSEMSAMKVSELRTIVTDKIGHVANLSKLKKNELLELLDKK